MRSNDSFNFPLGLMKYIVIVIRILLIPLLRTAIGSTVLAVSVWADSLNNKCISFHSDNRAIVDLTNSQTSKDTKVRHLMRKLVLSVCVTTSSSSSSHPWHKQQLGRLSILSAGGKVPGIGRGCLLCELSRSTCTIICTVIRARSKGRT